MIIAIIEDSDAHYEHLVYCFQQLGHQVVGEKIEDSDSLNCTLQAIEAGMPDIILLDHDLSLGSKVNGRTVMNQLSSELQLKILGISLLDQPYCNRAPFSKKSCSIEDIEVFIGSFTGAA